MRPSIVPVALLALGALMGVGLGFVYPGQWFQNPFQTAFSLEYPSFATVDREGNTYVIDHSLSRIRKIDADGHLGFELTGQNRQPGGFFYAEELAVDDEGYLYVLNQVMQLNGFYTEREEVLRYAPSGRFDRVVATRPYQADEIGSNNATRGRMVNLSIVGRHVSWFELGPRGAVENVVDTVTGNLEQHLAIPVTDAAVFLASVTRLDPKTLVYSTKQGMVWKQVDGVPELLYSGDQASESGNLSVPWWVAGDGQGGVLFSDLTRSRIVHRAPDGQESVVFDNQAYKRVTGDSFPYIYYTFSRASGGVVVTTNDTSVVRIEGDAPVVIQGGLYPIPTVVVRAALVLSLLCALGALVLIVRLVYTTVWKKRVSLIVKQLLVSLPLMSGILVVVVWALLSSFSSRFQAQAFDHIGQAVQLISQTIDTDRLDRIQHQQDFMDEDYRAIRAGLHRALNDNRDPWNNKFYFALHRLRDGKVYTAMYLNDGVGLYQPYTYLNDPNNLYWKAAQGKISISTASDAWGTWVFGVGPVYNKEGQISALLEVGRDSYGFQRETDQFLWSLLPLVLAGFGVLIALFAVTTWWFLAPLRTLRSGVKSISEGRWDTTLPVKGSDEVADLTGVFNSMSSHLRDYIDEIVALSQGYRRFVPQEFLQHLNKETVKEIQLGDQIQGEMSIMFTDIRGFTTISEKMTPKENFDFLNRYLSLVGPEVRRHEGFIDKYIGDAIMALFPGTADDALQAAIEIVDLLDEFNRQQEVDGLPAIQIGLGIHTGLLMLGILGERERMEGTVISDNVNLASRLEGLTKFFDASIIVSETTFSGVRNRDRYHFRYLGKVKVKGKRDPIGIYEVLDGLPRDKKLMKSRSQQNLEEGIRLYQERRLTEAVSEFQRGYQLSPDDVTIKVYLTLCRQALSQPTPEEWSGAITMNSK